MNPLPPIDEAWEQTAPLVSKIVSKFAARHGGGDREELRAEARLHWVEAYRSFDPARGVQFSTWLYHRVWYGLLDANTKRQQRWHRLPERPLGDADRQVPQRAGFDLAFWLNSLSEDARLLARLALGRKGDKILRKTREKLAETLLDVGWPGRRVAAAARELKEALG